MEIVKYSDLPLAGEPVTYCNGTCITLADGREIATFRIAEPNEPGVICRLRAPLPDGKTSELKFRVTDEAALALIMLLTEKLKVHTH